MRRSLLEPLLLLQGGTGPQPERKWLLAAKQEDQSEQRKIHWEHFAQRTKPEASIGQLLMTLQCQAFLFSDGTSLVTGRKHSLFSCRWLKGLKRWHLTCTACVAASTKTYSLILASWMLRCETRLFTGKECFSKTAGLSKSILSALTGSSFPGSAVKDFHITSYWVLLAGDAKDWTWGTFCMPGKCSLSHGLSTSILMSWKHFLGCFSCSLKTGLLKTKCMDCNSTKPSLKSSSNWKSPTIVAKV